MRWRWAGLALALVLSAAGSPAPDRDPACEERIGELGRACLLYADQHGGEMPASLGDLYYEAYVESFDAFVCPAHPVAIEARERIDLLSGYTLVPNAAGAEPYVVLRDASPENHGGAGVHEFLSDGSIRWRAMARPSAGPPRVSEVFTPLGHRVWLGVRTKGEEDGVRVLGVQSGGIGAQWGLVTGDVVLAFRGRGLAGDLALTRAVAGAEPGEHVPILVLRDGVPVALTVVVGDLPARIAGRPTKPRETTVRLAAIEVDPTLAVSAERLSCRIRYEDAPPDTHLVVDWLREGTVVATVVAGIEGRGSITATVYDLAGEGFSKGDYRVRATAGGRELAARLRVE